MARRQENKIDIVFKPSLRQQEVWDALSPNRCDLCGGSLVMASRGDDGHGHALYEPVCASCGNRDIPEVVLGGGSAGGGKSFLGCAWVIISCVTFPGITMVIARKELKSLLSTTWATLLRLIAAWGMQEKVHYRFNRQRMVITLWNGSTIMGLQLARSNQDPDYNRLGSLEITGAFIDEVSEIEEKAVQVLASRIRYHVSDTFVVGKLFMCTNPCTTWVRDTFVQDSDGNKAVLPKGYRYIPFSLFDNPDEEFKKVYFNKLEGIQDPLTRNRLLYGNWDFTEQNAMAAYYNFDGARHLKAGLKERYYNKQRPLILSFDFNVNPYMSCLPLQIDNANKRVYVFPEFIGTADEGLNNTPAFSRHIADILSDAGHEGGIIITGDPSGKARSTQTKEGINNYTIIRRSMEQKGLHASIRLLSKQPPHITRLEFINELLANSNVCDNQSVIDRSDSCHRRNGDNNSPFSIIHYQLAIDLRSRRLIDDLNYQRRNADGTKNKHRQRNADGTVCERYGHLSDCLDYALCLLLPDEYKHFSQSSPNSITTIPNGIGMDWKFGY